MPPTCQRAISLSFDSAFFLFINGSTNSPHWLTALALFSTSHLPQLMTGGAARVFLAGSRRVKLSVLQVLAAVLIAFVLAPLGQSLIAIDRPFVVGLGTQWLPHAATHSFPSAHATVAFAFAVATASVAWHWYWVLPALIVAALISWSRVYLGLHFPSNILAGALVGAASVWLACQIPFKILCPLRAAAVPGNPPALADVSPQ